MARKILPLVTCFISAPLYLAACGGQADVAEIDRGGDSVSEAEGSDDSNDDGSNDEGASVDDGDGESFSAAMQNANTEASVDDDTGTSNTVMSGGGGSSDDAAGMAAAGMAAEGVAATAGMASAPAEDGMASEPAEDSVPLPPSGGGPANQTMPTTAQAQELDPECYDTEIAGFWGNYAAVPSEGCSFTVEGDADECSAEWVCCGDVYGVHFSVQEFSPSEGPFATLEWTFPEIGGAASGVGMGGPHDGEACPLLGEDAATVAAQGFGYTPAWELAVRDTLGMDGEEPDPIPLQCMYGISEDDTCAAMIGCQDHTYSAGYDTDGALVCKRDGESVEPVNADLPTFECDADTAEYGLVPADPCFGPGWSKYFQIASAL